MRTIKYFGMGSLMVFGIKSFFTKKLFSIKSFFVKKDFFPYFFPSYHFLST